MKSLKSTKMIFAVIFGLTGISCSEDKDDIVDEPETAELSLNFSRLENLGFDFLYEGWLIVDDEPISTGTFSVDLTGVVSQSVFPVDSQILSKATKFVLTIEPSPDPSPSPSDTKLFTGDFTENIANLNTGTIASFVDISGKFIIAAPTGAGTEEERYSGIWFLDNSSGDIVAGLDLPTLEAGWKYEGWVVVNGVPLSTGTFTTVSGSDEAAPFSGANAGPMYPGEDFLENPIEGLQFPVDIRGEFVVISVEPFPDNSPGPFTLRPLAGKIPNDAMGVQRIGGNVVTSFPSGSASR